MDDYTDYFLLWPRTHADLQSRQGTDWMVHSGCLEGGAASSWEQKERGNKRSMLECLIGPQLMKWDISGSFWFWLTLSFLPRLYTLFTELLFFCFYWQLKGRPSWGKEEQKSVSQQKNHQRNLELPLAVDAKDVRCWFALFYYLWVCLLFVMMTIFSYCI